MNNEDFFNLCVDGSIRKLVAEFIDNSELLSKFRGEKYFELEDAIVNFIKENQETIAAHYGCE